MTAFFDRAGSIIMATLDGTANGFSGQLIGDVGGHQLSTSILSVAGQTAINVATSTQYVANAITATGDSLVSKDSAGNLIGVTTDPLISLIPTISTNLATETTRAITRENVLAVGINTEISRATASEVATSNLISIEATRATTAETANTVLIAAEATRAMAAEAIGLVRVTGTNNTAAGQGSFLANPNTGNDNTVFGYNSLPIGTGAYNTVVGSSALQATTTGRYNSALGYASLQQNTTGISNVGVGYAALSNSTTGSRNTTLGLCAFNSNTTGNSNTAIGFNTNATFTITSTGTSVPTTTTLYNTTLVGAMATVGAISTIALGYGASATGINSIAIGAVVGTGTVTAGTPAPTGAVASGANSTAIGASSLASGSYAIALGANVTAPAFTIQLGDANITTLKCNATLSSLSDGRSKTNIRENIPGIEFINLLRPVTYHNDPEEIAKLMKTENSKRDHVSEAEQAKIVKSGFIAQEVELAAKNIGYEFNGINTPNNDQDGYYSLSYSQFVVPLVQCCKQQHVRINILENTINDLSMIVRNLQEKLSK